MPEIGLTLLFVHIQATGNITEYFEPTIMEPRLLVFTDNEQLSQMFICTENQELFKGPREILVEELLHLMASYYVFGVEYPKVCRALLYFFQDILMARPDIWASQEQTNTLQNFY